MEPNAAPVARILVVEDDPSLNHIVSSYLSLQGHECTAAFSGTEGRLLFDAARAPFDLVVCDLMLPGASGEELIAHIRSSAGAAASVPVIVTSAKDQLADRVSLLRSGADDYLVKPFPLEELLARVEVQLRHAARQSAVEAVPSPVLRFGRWEADPAARSFLVDGAPVRLTRTEFDIAVLLMGNPRRVFSKQDLLDAIHGAGDLGEEKTVSTHVGNLRAKLKETGTHDYIQTVWGIGFKLVEAPR